MAAIDADDNPVGSREAAVKLELPLHILILAIGHHTRHLSVALRLEKIIAKQRVGLDISTWV